MYKVTFPFTCLMTKMLDRKIFLKKKNKENDQMLWETISDPLETEVAVRNDKKA